MFCIVTMLITVIWSMETNIRITLCKAMWPEFVVVLKPHTKGLITGYSGFNPYKKLIFLNLNSLQPKCKKKLGLPFSQDITMIHVCVHVLAWKSFSLAPNTFYPLQLCYNFDFPKNCGKKLHIHIEQQGFALKMLGATHGRLLL